MNINKLTYIFSFFTMNNDYLRLFETESDYDSAKDGFVYPTVSYVRDVDDVKYMNKPILSNCFYVEALADGMTVALNNTIQINEEFTITAPANDLEYSTDQQVWTTLPSNTASPAINTGERIYLRGNATSASDFESGMMGMGFFNITQSCNVGGNIMSLLFNDNFEDKTDLTGYNGAFAGLFTRQPVVNAHELILPATTLAIYCYNGMFSGCTQLEVAPALPATNLTAGCYSEMFNGCTLLTTAPALPATTLADGCYSSMFHGCTSLTTAPALPATTLADRCYSSMFYGCTSLTTAPALPATTLADSCYSSMFYGCTSLTSAPELPATTLADSCYGNMFDGCTSLTTAPELPATTLVVDCYGEMFRGCTSLTTAPVLPATTLADSCYFAMFSGCTSLTTVLELPATTLADGCCGNMFYGCKNLNNITMLAKDISAVNCLYNWVNGVSATGTFVKNPALSESVIGRGVSGIPSGWTVVDA